MTGACFGHSMNRYLCRQNTRNALNVKTLQGISSSTVTIALSRRRLALECKKTTPCSRSPQMEALNVLLTALTDSNPLAVVAIVVLAFLFVFYSVAKMAFRTIERLSQRGESK